MDPKQQVAHVRSMAGLNNSPSRPHAASAPPPPPASTPAPAPASGPPPAGPFVLRIVDLDYQMLRPIPGVDVCYSSLACAAIIQVPVVRIFGATPAGQKACLHLHRVRPLADHLASARAMSGSGKVPGLLTAIRLPHMWCLARWLKLCQNICTGCDQPDA